MTVYVDFAAIPATVGPVTSRWYHLLSDDLDPAELHAFAARIGMRRAWFQPGRRPGTRERDVAGDHYDLSEDKRAEAVAAGATEIDRDALVVLMRRRRTAARALLAVAQDHDVT